MITSPRVETKILLDENSPLVLNVENPHEYYRTVNQLIAAFDGEPSDFSFWKEDAQVSADKVGEILIDVFSFALTDKRIITLLYKKLQRNFSEGVLALSFQEVRAAAEKFLFELCATENFAMDFEEISLDALLKACAVKPAQNYETLLEKIVCYLNIFVELKGVSCFVFVGLKGVLSDEDLHMLYEHCRLQKISLLLLEGGGIRQPLQEERAIIITEDLCEIVQNFD